MALNKTLYVRPEDELAWKQAEELRREGSMSRLVAALLREYVRTSGRIVDFDQHFDFFKVVDRLAALETAVYGDGSDHV